MNRTLLLLIVIATRSPLAANAADADQQVTPQTGEVHYLPAPGDDELPAFFQLAEHRFDFQQRRLASSARQIEVFEVTFPSPVATEQSANNTVHCEYFRPEGDGEYPGVVALHILGGDFDLSRLFCRHMAHHGVAALFLKMPYYGPRATATRRRMITLDPHETVEGMQQAVLDIRRAAAWLGSREEVDEHQLGVFGISLGGITAALAATVEPRFGKACLMLAGGDVGELIYKRPETRGARDAWLAAGGTLESLVELLRSVDPVTYGSRMRGRQVLMLNASRDEIIPRASTESLWRALGEPEIRWWDAGHYSAILHLFDGTAAVTRFFQSGEGGAAPQAPDATPAPESAPAD